MLTEFLIMGSLIAFLAYETTHQDPPKDEPDDWEY